MEKDLIVIYIHLIHYTPLIIYMGGDNNPLSPELHLPKAMTTKSKDVFALFARSVIVAYLT